MIVQIALPLILAFIMFSLGLGLRGADFGNVLRYPVAFSAGLLNQIVLLPLIAFACIHLFGIRGEMAFGVMILSFCPGGVTSNVLTRIANGNTPLSISLTAVTSLLSVLTVPFLVAWFSNRLLGDSGPEIVVTKLGFTMFLITAVPVAIGMLVTAKAPGFVERRAKMISKIAVVLFVLIIIAALAKNRVVFFGNLPTLGPALISLNVTMLALGLLTGAVLRMKSQDTTTIAIESGVQNGTLGIAVGALIAASADESLPPVTVASAVYGITMYLVSLPFVFWRKGKGS